MENAGHGGLRNPPGGRPKGSTNRMPMGAVRTLLSIKSAMKRLKNDPDPEAKQVLEYVYGRVVDVLENRVNPASASNVLKAASMILDAIAGKQPEKVEVDNRVTLEKLVLESQKPNLPGAEQ